MQCLHNTNPYLREIKLVSFPCEDHPNIPTLWVTVTHFAESGHVCLKFSLCGVSAIHLPAVMNEYSIIINESCEGLTESLSEEKDDKGSEYIKTAWVWSWEKNGINAQQHTDVNNDSRSCGIFCGSFLKGSCFSELLLWRWQTDR